MSMSEDDMTNGATHSARFSMMANSVCDTIMAAEMMNLRDWRLL